MDDSPADRGDSSHGGEEGADDGSAAATSETDGSGDASDAEVDDLLTQLESLESTVDEHDEREQVRKSIRLARRIDVDGGLFDQNIRKYTTDDIAESLVGAVVFSFPMLVEDGVNVIADHFLRSTVAGVPAFYLANVVIVVVLTYGLLYWTDIQNVAVYRPLFGIVPRRLVGTLAVSFLTATALMMLWGRISIPGEPMESLARVTVVWTIAAVGAGLGDILPGESDRQDVNDALDDLVN